MRSVESSFSIAGLPSYLAPEQVRGEGHAFPVDWWALGVLAYELSCAAMPFGGSASEDVNELAVAQAILEHRHGGLTFTASASPLSEYAREMIASLLHPDPLSRLGGEAGASQLFGLEIFSDVSWKQIVEGSATSPLAGHAAEFIQSGSIGHADVTDPTAEFATPPGGMGWAEPFK